MAKTRVLSGKQLEAKMARIARAKAVKKPPTPIGPGHPIPYSTLAGMIGKYLNDSDVKATFATVRAVETKGYIIARDAGFSFMLMPSGAEDGTMVLGTLFLYADGSNKYRGFMDLPSPFIFGERAAVIAAAPPPSHGFSQIKGRKKGLIPLEVGDVYKDSWQVGKLEISASYSQGYVSHYIVLPSKRSR